MLRCGLLGKTLGHSYSPAIHRLLGDYAYDLFEKSEEELPRFLTEGDWDGLNVTIPYKKTVVPYCAALSPAAAALGSVNTLVRRPDGSLYGDNTDLFGFLYLLGRSGLSPAGKKALVLGSGGASVTVAEALRQQGASEVVVISRSGENNYQNLSRHGDAALIVNTTPVGMYPGNGASPLSLTVFPRCEGVLDIVYNPERTALCLEADRLGIPAFSGLPCWWPRRKRVRSSSPARPSRTIPSNLSAALSPPGPATSFWWGCRAAEKPPSARLFRIPWAGPFLMWIRRSSAPRAKPSRKSLRSRARRRSGILNPASSPSWASVRAASSPPAAAASSGKKTTIRSTRTGPFSGSRRDLSLLPRTGRPLSQGADLPAMYEARRPRYARFADYAVDNSDAVTDTAEQILSLFFFPG